MSSQPPAQDPSLSSDKPESPEKALADCLLGQFSFFLGGAGLGTAFALNKKSGNIMPLLVGGMAGSVVDLVYGYTIKCVQQVEATKQPKNHDSVNE
jgi:hypothetical protein